MRTVTCHSFATGHPKAVEFFEDGVLIQTTQFESAESADDAIWLYLVDGYLPYWGTPRSISYDEV